MAPWLGLKQSIGKCICCLYTDLRTPEPVGLAHKFCATKVSVCSKFIEKDQIIIISIKYAMCNIHIND